jgi:type IX secretion system PorP/SprF family membrane protein
MKRILYAVIFFSLLAGGKAVAQTQPQFSHYGFNGMYLSPGYAGINKATEFNMIGRYQWFGYKADFNDDGGSPKTALFNVSIPVRAIKGGLGVNFAVEEIALTTVKSGQLAYSYHLPVGNGKLGIGGQGTVTNIGKGYGYRAIDVNDPNIPNVSNDTKFDVGAGLWYQADKFYAGAGINNLLGSKYEFETFATDNPGNKTASVTNAKHLYVTAGYNIDASSSVVVTPTALLKYDLESKPSFDLGARATINTRYWIGANYRHQEAITGMVGGGLLKDNSLRLGYAFDFTTFEKVAKGTGSHEIMLSYRIPQLGAAKPPIRTPRYSF